MLVFLFTRGGLFFKDFFSSEQTWLHKKELIIILGWKGDMEPTSKTCKNLERCVKGRRSFLTENILKHFVSRCLRTVCL